MADPPTRSGFIAITGRPNAGKSTLVNRIVGGKVAIVSDKPQTTRRAVRGIATGDGWQLALVDLPGVQRPRDELTARMQRRVERELGECDAALLLLNGEQEIGPGDRFTAEAIAKAGVPGLVALNKVDLLSRRRTLDALAAIPELGLEAEIFPVSARTGEGLDELLEALVALAPEGPFAYPADQRSDQPERVVLAELIREQALLRTRQEIPHAVEVEVVEVERRDDELVGIEALIWAETDSQKAILIGAGGQMVKAIGSAARRELEAELGAKVFLDLKVQVRPGWRRDSGLLDRLGLE